MKITYFCPCCGYQGLDKPAYKHLDSLPVPEDLSIPYCIHYGEPTYDVCSCCGYEFGNEDEPGTAVGSSFCEYLKEWKSKGCHWFEPAKKPHDWDLETQLEVAGIKVNSRIEILANSAKFELQRTENDDRATCFEVKLSNAHFSAQLEDFWIDHDAIKVFSRDLEKILESKDAELSLNAYSDFELNVIKIDRVGHFKLTFKLMDHSTETTFKTSMEVDFPILMYLKKYLENSFK